jgi:hypothetical protein
LESVSRELLAKKENLKISQPILTKLDTAKYRNSYKHNLCLEMLQEGLHKSFAEIHNLMKQQQVAREKAGSDSALWMQASFIIRRAMEALEHAWSYFRRYPEGVQIQKY